MRIRWTVVGALLLACVSPVAGTTLQVTAGELFHLAEAALKVGDEVTARQALHALLEDPSPEVRLEARFRLAKLENARGKRRSDSSARLSLGATFRQLEWRGFAPVARLSIERSRSSIEFYDYRRTRTEMGIVRAL